MSLGAIPVNLLLLIFSPPTSSQPWANTFLGTANPAAKADAAICELDFQGGILAIMDFCKKVNGYVTEKEPWILAKDPANQQILQDVLYNTAESLRALAVLLNAVMPQPCEILWSSLGAQASLGDLGAQKISDVATWGQLPPGVIVTKTPVLFPRLETNA